jgi:hypothetical protein
MSELDGFYDFLYRAEIGLLDEKTRKEIDAKSEEWGWRWESPKTENGKKLAILICYYSANWIAKNLEKGKESLDQVADRYRYLATGFLVEKGIKFHEFNLIGFKQEKTATKWGLKRLWKKEINLNNFWYKTCDLFGGKFWAWVGIFLYWLASIFGIVGFIQYHFGATSNGFYRFLFDQFTVNFLFYQSILFFILNSILLVIWEDGWDNSLGAVTSTLYLFSKNTFILKERKSIAYACYILSIASVFIPFYNFLFNISFFLHFLIVGEWFYEENHIYFALFNIKNYKRINNFFYGPKISPPLSKAYHPGHRYLTDIKVLELRRSLRSRPNASE